MKNITAIFALLALTFVTNSVSAMTDEIENFEMVSADLNLETPVILDFAVESETFLKKDAEIFGSLEYVSYISNVINNETDMKKVTLNELVEILEDISVIKGMGLMASITQHTTPQITKKCRDTKEVNPFNVLTKLTTQSILLNTEYETGVVKQLTREGKEATEYEKGINTMPIEFKGKNNFIGWYKGEAVLQYRPHEKSHPRTKYLADGKLIDKSKLPNVLPKSYKASNQGTDKEILWRKLYLKNVRKLTIMGETYKLIQD